MKTSTTVSLVLSLGLANAQVRFCDGNRRPSWEDCESVITDFAMQGNPDVAHINGQNAPMPSCQHWWWNGGNCLISHCFEPEPNDGNGDPRSVSLGQVHQLYENLRLRCQPLRAGGEFTGAFQFVAGFNDEGGDGPPSKRSMVKRGVFPELESRPDGMTVGYSTLDEYLEWRNDTAKFSSSTHENKLAKRQNQDDTSFTYLFEARGIRHPTELERGPRLSKGVGYTYDTSQSNSYSVTTSVSMGAAWNVFTASAGVEATEEETFTVSETLTFDVNCDNQGQITFYPLYDYYEVQGQPSGTVVEIWVPVLSNERKVNGEIAVACLG